MRLTLIPVALATLALATAAQAQDATAPAAAAEAPSISLGVDSGSVLVSTGGEFIQAASGHAVAPGHRVLVSEGGSATLTYGNGCQKRMSAAGVYTVSPDCVAPGADSGTAGSAAGPSAGLIAGIVGGVAVIAAAAGGGGGSSTPPISR